MVLLYIQAKAEKTKFNMNKSKLIYVALIPIFTSACAPSTAGGVRALGPSKSVNFEAKGNYQDIYKNVLQLSKECNDVWLGTANVVSEGEVQPETKTGTISVSLRGALGKSYSHVIDIKEIDNEKSLVNAFYSIGSAANQSKILKKWILEDYKKCS